MARKATGNAKSNLQRQHEYQDNACSIDAALEEAWKNVDWDRRNRAEKGGLVEWTNTYMIGLTLEEPPPPLGEKILR